MDTNAFYYGDNLHILSNKDIEDLKLLEEGLWRVETRFDPERMDRIFAPDFIEFGRSGRIWGRDEMMDMTAQPMNARLPLIDFNVRLLDSNIALVTYVSAVTYGDVEELANRSSIWSRTEGGWRLRFHQGTAIPR